MNDQPLGERVRAVEVSLKAHLLECARKHEKAFRVNLVVLASILTVLAKVFGLI